MSILPRLALNFTTGVLDPRITFARALNTATRVNSSGLIEIINADLPRFDYDFVTLQPKGLLIEEARTNLVRNSVLDGAVAGSPGTAPTNWLFLLNTGQITATAPSVLSFSATVQRIMVYQTVTAAANTTYCLSVRILANSGMQFFQLFSALNVPSGSTVTYYANGNVITSYIPVAGDVLTAKVDVAGTAGSVALRFGVGISSNITGTATIGYPQLEAGAFPTSYIPTTTAAATRNADVATITGTNFSSFWQATRGGASVRATPSTVSGIRPLAQFDDNTADNIIALRGNTTNPELYVRSGGADQATIDAGTIAANTAYRLAGTWAADNCAANLNGGVPVLDTSATIPTATQMRLGSDGTNYLNGHLQSIEYYNERILNSNLQVVSSPAGYRSIIGPVLRDSIIT